jgi:hypothetical protein
MSCYLDKNCCTTLLPDHATGKLPFATARSAAAPQSAGPNPAYLPGLRGVNKYRYTSPPLGR